MGKYTMTVETSLPPAGSPLPPWHGECYVVQTTNTGFPPNKKAPDVYKINSNYYCFYAVSTAGSHDSVIGYATSPTMDPGSWTDQHALVSSNNNTPWNAIDPNFSVDANNKLRLQWGSYWENIWIADLSVGSDAASASVADNEKQVAYDPAGNHQVEGAFLFNNGQYWYQFLSVGDCCTYDPLPPAGEEYRIVACRSSSPTGPFVDAEGKSCTQGGGTTVLASHGNVYAPGGQGVLRDPAHGDVLYYHYCKRSPSIPIPGRH